MPTSLPVDAIAAAYAREATTWLALEGRIPGHPKHDPTAWTAWREALREALKVAADKPEPPPCTLF